MHLLALLCILAAHIYVVSGNDTMIGDLVGKIHIDLIGGDESTPHKWPWHASLYAYDQFTCSATLISDRWIVTAAHCLFNFLNQQIKPFRFGVRLGLHFLTIHDPNEQARNVSKVVVNPDFQYVTFPDSGQLIPVHDIGLLQLATPVFPTKYVQWIHLPATSYSLKSGDSAYSTGWGYIFQDIEGRRQVYNVTKWGIITTTTTLTIQPDALQQLQMGIDSGQNCTDITQNQTDMICVSNPEGGTGPCQGDSGGPLVAQKGKRWILYGVLSFGPMECAIAGVTGVYTKVASHVRWILNITQARTY